ncbi:IS3 family transposase [Candidatus Parcubacteria bacterium]|nr:IS3 family transposase [Candidatus Parcubacteria bacterium]
MANDKGTMISKKKLASKLGIARSTLYYQSKKKVEDEVLKQEIVEVMDSNPAYGYRRVAIALKHNSKKIARIMKHNRLKPRLCRRKWSKKQDIGLPAVHYQNHLKELTIAQRNIVWVADFTYIKFRDKFLYLATVIDVYDKEVIGFAISSRHNRYLVKSATLLAIKKRGCLPQYFHSDQGSEYQSQEHTDWLEQLGVTISMSKKGSPWENGYQESFYSQFKLELGNVSQCSHEGEALERIYNQIYYYNNHRIHSGLKMPPSLYNTITATGRFM